MVLFPTFNNGFGMVSVSGLRRSPLPPAISTGDQCAVLPFDQAVLDKHGAGIFAGLRAPTRTQRYVEYRVTRAGDGLQVVLRPVDLENAAIQSRKLGLRPQADECAVAEHATGALTPLAVKACTDCRR